MPLRAPRNGTPLLYTNSSPSPASRIGLRSAAILHELRPPDSRRPEMPGRKELPGTLKRSPKKAQETWIETHDSAVESYGEGERAHRTAFSSLKHSFEKVDDH